MKCDFCKYRVIGMDDYPCNKCIHNAIDKFVPVTYYDAITSMSVAELANFICDIYASNEHGKIRVDGKWMLPEDVEEWLESNVSE